MFAVGPLMYFQLRFQRKMITTLRFRNNWRRRSSQRKRMLSSKSHHFFSLPYLFVLTQIGLKMGMGRERSTEQWNTTEASENPEERILRALVQRIDKSTIEHWFAGEVKSLE